MPRFWKKITVRTCTANVRLPTPVLSVVLAQTFALGGRQVRRNLSWTQYLDRMHKSEFQLQYQVQLWILNMCTVWWFCSPPTQTLCSLWTPFY